MSRNVGGGDGSFIFWIGLTWNYRSARESELLGGISFLGSGAQNDINIFDISSSSSDLSNFIRSVWIKLLIAWKDFLPLYKKLSKFIFK
ncbi:MAG: hypothetical protein Ta2E_01010 [Mycoplasmoidaceae bacterium]|nr:MAG: hypothetical protein Ta2E_01010 [Mycoplasmoidaceae bacterium]